MLSINNLHASVEHRDSQGITLDVKRRSACHHGTNGSQEHAGWRVAGREAYEVTEDRGSFWQRSARSWIRGTGREGIFLPFSIPWKSQCQQHYFLRAALNAVRKHRGRPNSTRPVPGPGEEKIKILHIAPDCSTTVNEGFRAGKRTQRDLQMAVLDPSLRFSMRPIGLDMMPSARVDG